MNVDLEMWASPDPTVARINHNEFRDQLRETGHDRREDDIERIARLGVSATRYPVLWEKVAPHHPDERDYTWSDRRLFALATAGVEPIVTLLHHGSGPSYTSLVDPRFPELFADYAEATARRYPWVKRWSPINEPLTTARFSTLYGHWYPNERRDAAFGRAMLNQMRAFALASARIRSIVPDASFLLTEDLQNHVAGDKRSRAAAEHFQERVFLSCELLQGRVVPGHPAFTYLTEACGIDRHDLDEMAAVAIPPDVMGWNYYPYSEQIVLTGSSGAYSIPVVENAPERLDFRTLLAVAHERLQTPIALSEVHTFGTENERARWLLARHEDARALRSAGIPIVAFGAWAAFGLVGWRSLLCNADATYEDGIYTCAGPHGIPRPTLVADVIQQICAGRIPVLPASEPAWWERGRVAA